MTQLILFPEKKGLPYMPSNGSEGLAFEAEFCDECERYCSDEGCEIHWNAMIDDVQPEEWVYNTAGEPICTAFEKVKE